mmetsp:Transcript_21255/g.45436  ORF Transcript_21255/g.45436 Transcript_21255/m.45436 type:complete len:134 (+) Transcript_21255:15-416(+)
MLQRGRVTAATRAVESRCVSCRKNRWPARHEDEVGLGPRIPIEKLADEGKTACCPSLRITIERLADKAEYTWKLCTCGQGDPRAWYTVRNELMLGNPVLLIQWLSEKTVGAQNVSRRRLTEHCKNVTPRSSLE